MNIYEWNIHMAATFPCNNGYVIQTWVADEIFKDEPDCVVLTEFVVSKGWDYLQRELEKKNYNWFISNITGQNGILIALKRNDTYDFSDVFGYKNETINSSEVLSKKQAVILLPNFYEIRIKINKEVVSIIGARIRDAQNTAQFHALDDYLSSLKHKVICVGDFNAYWAGKWNSPANHTLSKTSRSYDLYTPPYKEGPDWYSFVHSNGDRVQLDHLITNIKSAHIIVKYDWDFVNQNNGYNNIQKNIPNKPKGLPDHAILKAEIDF